MNASNSSSVINSNTITSLQYSILKTPFADYGCMQYFVEKVKYRIYL